MPLWRRRFQAKTAGGSKARGTPLCVRGSVLCWECSRRSIGRLYRCETGLLFTRRQMDAWERLACKLDTRHVFRS